MIENKNSFVLYESVYKQLNALHTRNKKEEELELIRAIIEYGLYGVIPEEESNVWLYGFEQAATSISAAKTRYEAAKENGAKGGRPVQFPMMEMVKYREQGMSNKEIAAAMGCSLKTVENKLKDYDSKPESAEQRKNRKNLNENVNVNVNVNDNENDNVISLRGYATTPRCCGDTLSGNKPVVEDVLNF